VDTRHSFIKFGIAAIALFVSVANSYANGKELCAPFKNSKVDQSLVAMMLAAAEEGGLYLVQSSSSKVGFCVNSLIGRVDAEFTVFRVAYLCWLHQRNVNMDRRCSGSIPTA